MYIGKLKFKANRNPIIFTAFILLICLLVPKGSSAATTPTLGTANTFGVLADTFISNSSVFMSLRDFGDFGPTAVYAASRGELENPQTFRPHSNLFAQTAGVTAIMGDLGYTTLGGSGTHTVTGSTHVADSLYNQAGTDQGSTLTALAVQPCTFTFADGAIDLAMDTTQGPIGAYTPGVYCTGASGTASIGTAGITLSGTGTYIFRINGALTSVDDSNVTLANGASVCDIFWTPTGATTLGENTTFTGTVIDTAGITVGENTVWNGRALAFGGTVSTHSNNIIAPTCASPISGGGSGTTLAPIFPLISVTKVPKPLALTLGPGSVTYTYTLTNIGLVAMYDVTVDDDKCFPIEYVAGNINGDLMLDTNESWVFRCTKYVAATETNTVTAHGAANNAQVWDIANATVVVSTPGLPSTGVLPPLIHLVKIPNVFTLPVGGGRVTYNYNVSNPGVAPLSDVSVTDNKCTGLPDRVVGHPGDLNKNDLLETNEVWSFTCETDITETTTNIGAARGSANGLTAIDFAPTTVTVAGSVSAGAVSFPGFPNTGGIPGIADSVPRLPNTAIGVGEKNIPWVYALITGILGMVLITRVMWSRRN